MDALHLMVGVARRAVRAMGYDVVRANSRTKVEGSLGLGLARLPIRTVLDIGANEGQFASQARRTFPLAHVLSFEPVPAAFAALECWAETQKGKATAINIALGESEGSADMFLHSAHTPSSSLLKTTPICESHYPVTASQETIRVGVRRLDEVLADRKMDEEILLKLDVQGFEDRVLRGAPETLRRARACIIEIDLDPLYDGQAHFDEIVQILGAAGLKFAGLLDQIAARDGHVIYADAVFERR